MVASGKLMNLAEQFLASDLQLGKKKLDTSKGIT